MARACLVGIVLVARPVRDDRRTGQRFGERHFLLQRVEPAIAVEQHLLFGEQRAELRHHRADQRRRTPNRPGSTTSAKAQERREQDGGAQGRRAARRRNCHCRAPGHCRRALPFGSPRLCKAIVKELLSRLTDRAPSGRQKRRGGGKFLGPRLVPAVVPDDARWRRPCATKYCASCSVSARRRNRVAPPGGDQHLLAREARLRRRRERDQRVHQHGARRSVCGAANSTEARMLAPFE